jgi:putative glutathione S-transferase
MGLLVNGKWHTDWYDTKSNKGKFVRESSSFRNTISPTNMHSKFPAETNRYHLYVSYACPWAHRALIFSKLKQLDDVISVSVVKPEMLENGWGLGDNESIYPNLKYLYEVYLKTDSRYTGRVTVPVLWDKKTHTIVNNESAEIIRIFNSAFNKITGNNLDFYPQNLRSEIDKTNHFVYQNINNGVYKTGFATTQSAYNEAFKNLFSALDKVEKCLSQQPYLCGNIITEADWRLFTTLIRFDSVYHGHFKCNLKMIEQYNYLPKYLRRLYQHPGIAETVHFDHIKTHYYFSHKHINPTQIIPIGPDIDYSIKQ